MRLQVLQVIHLTRLCLVNTTVQRGLLLLSLRGLPKTPKTHYFQRREELIALARRAMIQVQETMAHKYNKSRRTSPSFSKGDRVWVRRQCKNLGDKTFPYWDGPYEVVAKKAHDLYVIQVDQRRLVDVHVDCFMKTVNSPRSPVPLNYMEEVARVPSQFEEDNYNVKKILVHRTYRKRLLFNVWWEGYTKDWDTECVHALILITGVYGYLLRGLSPAPRSSKT